MTMNLRFKIRIYSHDPFKFHICGKYRVTVGNEFKYFIKPSTIQKQIQNFLAVLTAIHNGN
jgi:hypothetical protein